LHALKGILFLEQCCIEPQTEEELSRIIQSLFDLIKKRKKIRARKMISSTKGNGVFNGADKRGEGGKKGKNEMKPLSSLFQGLREKRTGSLKA